MQPFFGICRISLLIICDQPSSKITSGLNFLISSTAFLPFMSLTLYRGILYLEQISSNLTDLHFFFAKESSNVNKAIILSFFCFNSSIKHLFVSKVGPIIAILI